MLFNQLLHSMVSWKSGGDPNWPGNVAVISAFKLLINDLSCDELAFQALQFSFLRI